MSKTTKPILHKSPKKLPPAYGPKDTLVSAYSKVRPNNTKPPRQPSRKR